MWIFLKKEKDFDRKYTKVSVEAREVKKWHRVCKEEVKNSFLRGREPKSFSCRSYVSSQVQGTRNSEQK